MSFIRQVIFIAVFVVGVFAQSIAQNRTINGEVIDKDGAPLRNVKIMIKGHKFTTYTDSDGQFTVSAGGGESLILETQGSKQRVQVPPESERMTVVYEGSQDVVSLGYGSHLPKQELTAAVELLSANDLMKTSVSNPANALFGKIPGLWISQNSGPPTRKNPEMNIRGLSTLGSRNMLVLVNGFERPVSSVAMEEIEDIKVFKDAAGKAIYGQQGANGVILISTKEGGNHSPVFNFSIERGITSPTRTPQFLEAAPYARAVNEARQNDGLETRYSETDIERYTSGDSPVLWPNVDWMDQVLGDQGSKSRFNFNVSGGDEKVDYFVNLTYQGEQGFYKKTESNPGYSSQIDYDQVNIRTTGSMDISPTTKVKIDLAGMIQNLQEPYQSNILNAVYSIPSNAFPVKNTDGSWGGTNLYGNNPVARLSDTGYSLNNRRDIFLTAQLNQELDNLWEGLSATLKVGYDNGVTAIEGERKNFIYKEFNPVVDTNGTVIDTTVTQYNSESDLSPFRGISGQHHVRSTDLEARFNYSNTFQSSTLNALISFHQQNDRTDVSNNTFRWQNLATNVHYGLKNKYFFDFTISYQGSNRIQNSKDRWGIFPAISASWLMSNEAFLQESSHINKLKLSASWGKTGNGYIPIRDLTSKRFGGGGGYNFGANNNSLPGRRQNFIGIPLKTFESSYETNIGIETLLFNKLRIKGDLFYAKRKNILVNSQGRISNVIGIDTGSRADGIVENKGFEVDIGWDHKIGEINYFLNGQVSFARNKIVNQNEVFRPYSYQKREGKQIGQRFGLETNGFFQDEADIADSPTQMFGEVRPGDFKYVDQNDDGVIDEYDQVPIGNSSFPNTYYSATLGFGYKGFDISASIQGVANRTVMLNSSGIFWPLRDNGNMSTWYTNYWTSENKNAELPRLTTLQNNNNFQANDVWLRDGSFIKLRYIELSYSLPNSITSKVNVDRAVIYLRGRNLYSSDKINYVDPENLNPTYPSIQAYNLGLKVQF